jgi:concanavalin A-like lectin/glucanase superfamily protein
LNPELEKLISALIDGRLHEPDRARLAELLRDDPIAQDCYSKHIAVHALLHLDFGDGQFQSLPPIIRQVPGVESEPARGFVASWRRIAPWALAASVALVTCGVLFGPAIVSSVTGWRSLSNSRSEERRIAENRFAQSEAQAIAVLGQASRVLWSSPKVPTEIGASLERGQFKLEQGLIQLEFVSGAAVIVEGPAEFELISPMAFSCKLGKIRAHVPNQARGFTIETPTYDAVDLGTEFTVQVDKTGESQFQVIDGEVELWNDEPPNSTLAQKLVKGQGIRSQPDGKLLEFGGVDSRVVGRQQMLEMAAEAMQERYENWKQASQRTRSLPGVLLYYGFDGHAPWDRVLRNATKANSGTLDGAIVGCQWTTGRWSGKQALEFKRTNDRVRLNVPGEFKSLTFSAWLRIEGFERWLSSLMLTDGHEPGEVHWQMTDLGQLMLGVKAEPDHSHDYYSPSIIGPLDLGRWVHFACVYSGEDRYVSHYVDGAEISRETIRRDTTLRIGPAEIGNWIPQDLQDYRIRSLNGRLDEFILFERALSPAEIKTIYEDGKPQS